MQKGLHVAPKKKMFKLQIGRSDISGLVRPSKLLHHGYDRQKGEMENMGIEPMASCKLMNSAKQALYH